MYVIRATTVALFCLLIMIVGSGSEDQLYIRFMEARCCYEAMPNSSKLVVFDTQLSVSIFHRFALVAESSQFQLHVDVTLLLAPEVT
jgi:hypothetical protein